MISTFGQRPAAPPEFNPLSDSALLDPASMYDQIRTEQPVFWHEQLGTWVVTRREDVETVLMDWKAFSCRGNGGNVPVPEQFTSTVTSRNPASGRTTRSKPDPLPPSTRTAFTEHVITPREKSASCAFGVANGSR